MIIYLNDNHMLKVNITFEHPFKNNNNKKKNSRDTFARVFQIIVVVSIQKPFSVKTVKAE